MNHQQQFLKDSELKAFDKDHRKKINFNINKYLNTVVKGKDQYANLELAKQRAAYLKWKTLENLDKYLIEFESNFTARGGKVIWANNAEEANKEILKVLQSVNAKSAVKSKSMTTEELDLNEFLEKNQIEPIETDLGEYIVQLAGEKPYHIVTPAMHKSKEDVAELFHEKLGTPIDAPPEELTLVARRKLRGKYTSAEVGITGANFLIADTGAIAITENEGNARLTITFPKIHIAIVGIEKMIPSMNDLSLFWPLLATHGTGQNVTVYNSIINGARSEDEPDGPEEMYVVLLDNGRSKILSDPTLRSSLACIRCGACLNVCPVYKNIGGHTYDTTYSGPIGSVISPHYRGLEDFKHLSHASSLCGNCSEVCPVKIPIHNLLLYNRKKAVDEDLVKNSEKWMWYFWKKSMLNRKWMNRGSSGMKNFFLKQALKKSWGKRRVNPQIAKKSFNQMWQER
ncbi:MAG: iron-sulfur cluster-binding protein [Bacteroidetes bacterium]|nr:MAG: iron-sulfur cluster-binding protein [Bacteroidota bacterium]